MSTKSPRTRRPDHKVNVRRLRAAVFEALESRRMLSLLGIAVDNPELLSQNTSPGSLQYTAAQDTFNAVATPVSFQLTAGARSVAVLAPSSFQFDINVDNNGNLTGTPNPENLSISGTLTAGGHTYSGTLLTGSIEQLGYTASGNTGEFDARLLLTGGSLSSFFVNQNVGIFITSEDSTFTGSFSADFTGETKAVVGPIPLVAPTISTTSGAAPALGTGAKVTDTATLSGGYDETGTITFNLYNPNNLLVDTETASVNGDGSYTTPTGYLPTVPGTYQWVDSYSGDASNSPVASTLGNEPVTVTQALPVIATSQQPASATVGTFITDTATLSGAFNPTGTITFNLYNNPNATGATLATDTEALSGDSATSVGYTTTATGTDYWVATYNGDGNNSAVSSGDAGEPVSITPAAPAISTTPGSAAVLGSGAILTDTAQLSGGYDETGAITFNLYNPNNLLVDTETASVNGDGSYTTPVGYLPTAPGTYQWVASYGGDASNSPVSSSLGSEPETISPAAPTISTSQQPASVTVGNSISDTATVSGGFNPTGTVTFNLYNNPNGAGTPLDTDTEVLSDGTATSQGYITSAAGTDFWVATYNGDSNNAAVSSGDASEAVTINPATPTISTGQQPASVTVGSSISDTATVSGGFNPTGTVTFNLYNNPDGAGTPLDTDTEALLDGTATSQGYTTNATGTDYWVANYNGDDNNAAVSSAASQNNPAFGGGPASEPVTINPATPTISTSQQPASATVGNFITDTATLSGGFNPTGTVTFNLYNNPNGAGTPLDTDTEALLDGTATSQGYTTNATGTDYWMATYNGDSNNAAVSSGDASEPVTVNPATPAISTSQHPASVTVGNSISDTATVSGGFNPTGTVTFNLYNNPDGTGTPLDTDTEALSGGTATSQGYTASAAGTDFWVATYNGDDNNAAVSSNLASEAVTISAASPAINTTPSGTVVINSGSKLSDSATLSGGYNESGTITFTLLNPSGTSVYTDIVTVTGNGSYTTTSGTNPGGFLPTASGTYQWVAAYSGDANNNTVSSSKGSEPQTVSLASPAITTTPGGTVVLGSGSDLTDSATLSGGYNESGTITFTLVNPSGTSVYTDIVTVAGNGSYSTSSGNNPGGFLPTASGTYQWVAAYSGDANNNNVSSALGNEPETVSSSASISGTVYTDATGNGLVAGETPLSGDTPLSGVVVDLYKDVNDSGVLDSSDGAPIATVTTGANGQYSFTGLPAGDYLVAEVAPTGDVQTAPTVPDYYAATLTATSQTGSLNFADYRPCNVTLQNVSFKLNSCSTVTNLRGNTAQGETVTVTFTVPAGAAPMLYSFATYNAPDPTFNASDASEQTIFQDSSGTFGPGTHTLTVTIPSNYYQIDFVCGAPITTLGPAGSNIFYSAQDRLISADNDGTHSDVDDESATMVFWANLGQTLIKDFGGSSTSTALGNWLSTTMPTVFGGSELGNKTNATVAAKYLSFYGVSGQKNMAQVMATALNVYASTQGLGGSTASSFGFDVTAAGLGAAEFAIGSNGAAFGVANNSTITVSQMLSAINAASNNDVLYNNVTSLLNECYNQLGQVNGDGGIN